MNASPALDFSDSLDQASDSRNAVLIADRNPIQRLQIAAVCVRLLGATIHQVDNGRDAVALLHLIDRWPTLILLEVEILDECVDELSEMFDNATIRPRVVVVASDAKSLEKFPGACFFDPPMIFGAFLKPLSLCEFRQFLSSRPGRSQNEPPC